MPSLPKLSTIYRINSQDIISSVNETWAAFALANEAPELAVGVEGTWLWKHVYGESVVDLNKAVVAQVRRSQRPATFAFRCDAPNLRRDMEMILRPLPDGGVEFETWVLRETHRAPILLLDRNIPRGEGIITMCAWCRKVKSPDWVEAEVAIARNDWFVSELIPAISHGICPTCLETLTAEYQSESSSA